MLQEMAVQRPHRNRSYNEEALVLDVRLCAATTREVMKGGVRTVMSCLADVFIGHLVNYVFLYTA